MRIPWPRNHAEPRPEDVRGAEEAAELLETAKKRWPELRRLENEHKRLRAENHLSARAADILREHR